MEQTTDFDEFRSETSIFRVQPKFLHIYQKISGSFRSFRLKGALFESFRAQVELQRPGCHKVGTVHRSVGLIRNQVLMRDKRK